MTKDEALKMCLEYIETDAHERKYVRHAIKEALAQTNTRPYYTIDELNAWADEKEKQAWRNAAIRIGEELSSVGPDGYYEMDAWKWLDWAMEQKPRGKNSLAQPEQEPVAFASHGVVNWIADKQFQHEALLYSAPQRTWVGLTNEERAECWETIPELAMRKVEAKLKEKNT